MNQLFEFFWKKFQSEVNSEFDIKNILKDYKNLNIAIRHADTFLINETKIKHDEIIKILEYYWVVIEEMYLIYLKEK